MVSLKNIFNKPVHVPYYSMSEKDDHNVNFTTITAKKKNATLYPNESMYFPLPVGFDKSTINISTRRNFVNGSSKIIRTDGRIKFTNSTNRIITLPTNEPFFDVRSCYELNMANHDYEMMRIRKIYDISRDDWSHFIPSSHPNPEGIDYSADVSIDPDDTMPATWKTRFKNICTEYRDIITPNPHSTPRPS